MRPRPRPFFTWTELTNEERPRRAAHTGLPDQGAALAVSIEIRTNIFFEALAKVRDLLEGADPTDMNEKNPLTKPAFWLTSISFLHIDSVLASVTGSR